MLHNDISNRQCPIIAFNIDNLLFSNEPAKSSVINNVLQRFSSAKTKYLSRKINKDFLTSIELLWSEFNYSVYFITFEDFTEDIEEFLSSSNIPYTRLVQVEEWDDLRLMCHNQFIYYFDTDRDLLSYMSTSGAQPIERLWEKVKR